MFGKRKPAPAPMMAPVTLPQPSLGADGKRRIFGEADFARHGALFRALGRRIDDPENIIPDKADFDKLIAKSLYDHELRRRGIEADMLARHGCNNIRPFFLFAEGVYKGQLGDWLIRLMNLMPYDDWNVTYLPMDDRTQAALDLPLHPQCAIPAIDELVISRMHPMWMAFDEALKRSRAEFERSGDIEVLARFNQGVDNTRAAILDWAAKATPLVIQIIAEAQQKK